MTWKVLTWFNWPHHWLKKLANWKFLLQIHNLSCSENVPWLLTARHYVVLHCSLCGRFHLDAMISINWQLNEFLLAFLIKSTLFFGPNLYTKTDKSHSRNVENLCRIVSISFGSFVNKYCGLCLVTAVKHFFFSSKMCFVVSEKVHCHASFVANLSEIL